MTVQQALIALYLLTDFRRAVHNGTTPSTDWIWRQGVLAGLLTESRKAQLRLARRQTCIACLEPIAKSSTGDHVVALANGGAPGLGNYLPACKSCNSSKGTKDLLQWWYRRGKSAADLPADAMTTYARLVLRQHVDRNRHNRPAETWHRDAVEELFDVLPTPEHRRAFERRVSIITGAPFEVAP